MAVYRKVACGTGTDSHDKRKTNRDEPVFTKEMEAGSIPGRDVPSISSRMVTVPASEPARFQCVCVCVGLCLLAVTVRVPVCVLAVGE